MMRIIINFWSSFPTCFVFSFELRSNQPSYDKFSVGLFKNWSLIRACFLNNPKSVLKNEMLKLLGDFDLQTDNIFSSRRRDLVTVNKNKRTYQIVEFAVSDDNRIKSEESEKKDKYLDLARKLIKIWNMKVTVVPIIIGGTWNNPQGTGKWTGRLWNKRTRVDYPDYSFIKIGQNTEKIPGD